MEENNWPATLAEINDGDLLTTILKTIMPGDCTFSISNGFIYVSDSDEPARLCYYRLEDIEEMYAFYHYCVKNCKDFLNYCIISPCMGALAQKNYLMLGGSFKFISANRGIHEEDDILFRPTPSMGACCLVYTNCRQLEADYYNVPKEIDNCAYFGLAQRTKINYRFNMLRNYNYDCDNYIIIDGIHDDYRITVDPYDKVNSCICADTFDLVSLSTGERIKTWPLIVIAKGSKEIKEKLPVYELEFSEKLKSSGLMRLLYDPQHNTYHIYSGYGRFYQARSIKSGMHTKPANKFLE